MKRAFSACLLLALLTLPGCTRQVVLVPSSHPSPSPAAATGPVPPEGAALRTGLSVAASMADSTPASDEADGAAQADVTLVAVTVGTDGVIYGCVIDSVQCKLGFTDSGGITTGLTTQFPSKNTLGEDYGMKAASGIGREWNEQAAALAQYAVGKTVEQLKGIAVNERGAPADADLAASVTISVTGFIDGIERAVQNALGEDNL